MVILVRQVPRGHKVNLVLRVHQVDEVPLAPMGQLERTVQKEVKVKGASKAVLETLAHLDNRANLDHKVMTVLGVYLVLQVSLVFLVHQVLMVFPVQSALLV